MGFKSKDSEVFFKKLKKLNKGDAMHIAVYDAFDKIFPPKR